MDGHRFDGLTRALSSGLSRRQALTVLGATLSGSGLLAALSEEANALSRKAKRRCRRAGGAVCSAGTKRACCSPSGECLNGACICNNDCPNDRSGQCHCAAAVGGVTACCDNNACCDIDTPCTSNADCTRPGSFCAIGCGPPNGTTNTCTNPCIPGGSSA
jgi:hypothetical protein